MADITLPMDRANVVLGTSDGASVTTQAVDRASVLTYRRSPAQALVDEMAEASSAAVRLREVPFLSQIAIRASREGRSGQAVGAALGVALPARVGEVAGATDGSGVAVLWLSPDESLVVGPDETVTGVSPEGWAGELADALGAEPGQVVDVSANRTTLELVGRRARSVLEKSCELDLHPRAFPVGTAVVTLLGSTGVIIWRSGDDVWRVMPRASFATHVVRWLIDGMREYR